MLPTTTTPIPARPVFVYDAAGNRTGRTNVDGSNPSSYTYDYDVTNEGLSQLGSRTSGSLVTSYLYGANGNRTRQQDVVSSTVMGTWEYDWNEDDRLVAFRVKNGQGNVTKTVRYEYCRTCGGQRTGRVEYDENDEVVEWLRYEMDGLNHLRIDVVYDADSNGELEDPAATGDAWRVQRVYINGPGQLGQIAKVIVFTYASTTTNTVASEEVYYYHYDLLGNVSVISDPTGDEADQFEQDAFGNLTPGETWTGRVGGITEQITTKQYDDDLGLYYFNARWYDPQVGQWISAEMNKPMGRYTMTLNNQVKYADVDGRSGKESTPDGKVRAHKDETRPYFLYTSLLDKIIARYGDKLCDCCDCCVFNEIADDIVAGGLQVIFMDAEEIPDSIDVRVRVDGSKSFFSDNLQHAFKGAYWECVTGIDYFSFFVNWYHEWGWYLPRRGGGGICSGAAFSCNYNGTWEDVLSGANGSPLIKGRPCSSRRSQVVLHENMLIQVDLGAAPCDKEKTKRWLKNWMEESVWSRPTNEGPPDNDSFRVLAGGECDL